MNDFTSGPGSGLKSFMNEIAQRAHRSLVDDSFLRNVCENMSRINRKSSSRLGVFVAVAKLPVSGG